MVKSKIKRNKADVVLDVVIHIVLVAIAGLMIFPFLNVIAVSFSSYGAYLKNPMMVWPQEFTVTAFQHVFNNESIQTGYVNTIFITITGTIIGLLLTILTAYPLSQKKLPGKRWFMIYILFTSLFSGGLVPGFILMKNLRLIDSIWALILPSMLNSFNIFLAKNFFEGLPESLSEAASIDGASDMYILWKIILPISKSIMATIALFIAVTYWNTYFNAIIYIRSEDKWPLQLVLREIISAATAQNLLSGGDAAEISKNIPTQGLQYASLVVVVLPILCVYPFLQKYFVQGVTLGAVKG